MLLEPTYPYLFEGWTQKVNFLIGVAKDTPPGKYMVVVSPNGKIPDDVEKKWELRYTTGYVSMDVFVQPVLLLGVEVS